VAVIRIRIRIATLVRRALAEVCSVPVLRFYFAVLKKRQSIMPWSGVVYCANCRLLTALCAFALPRQYCDVVGHVA